VWRRGGEAALEWAHWRRHSFYLHFVSMSWHEWGDYKLTGAGGGEGEAASVFTLASGGGEDSRFIFGVSSRLI
jgi:hypothetical protein